MKNSTKFWYSVLVIFLGILIYNYFIIITAFLFSIYLVIILTFGIACTIISFDDEEAFEDDKKSITYILGVKYNIIYFVFYTCVIKFNNFLNNK